MQIFTDGISKITFSNHNLRVVLVQNGPDNQPVEVGTLVIPANQAANFVNGMASGLKQIDEQINAKGEEMKQNKEEIQ